MKDVRTYVQSGNVVVSSAKSPDAPRARMPSSGSRRSSGSRSSVVARTRDELAEVVRAATRSATSPMNPKRYQVSFLRSELDREVVEKLSATRRRVRAVRRDRPRALRLAPRGRGPFEAVDRLGGQGPRRHRDRAQLDDGHDAAGDGRDSESLRWVGPLPPALGGGLGGLRPRPATRRARHDARPGLVGPAQASAAPRRQRAADADGRHGEREVIAAEQRRGVSDAVGRSGSACGRSRQCRARRRRSRPTSAARC